MKRVLPVPKNHPPKKVLFYTFKIKPQCFQAANKKSKPTTSFVSSSSSTTGIDEEERKKRNNEASRTSREKKNRENEQKKEELEQLEHEVKALEDHLEYLKPWVKHVQTFICTGQVIWTEVLVNPSLRLDFGTVVQICGLRDLFWRFHSYPLPCNTMW